MSRGAENINIKTLEQYGYLKKEIAEIEKKINKLKEQKEVYITDTVTASSDAPPYQKQLVHIRAHDKSTKLRLEKIQRLQESLYEREIYVEMKLYEIERFIISVNDSIARQIIDYKYIDGLTWTDTASKLYGYPCADRARKYLNNVLRKQ